MGLREHGGLSIFDQFQLRIFEAGFRRFETHTWATQNVLDTFWRFYFNFRDGALLHLGQSTFELRRDTPCFVPAGVRFDCDNRQPVDHFYVHFDVLGWPGHQLKGLFPAPLEVPVDTAFRETIQRFAHELPQDQALDVVRQCRLKSLLWEAFARTFESLPAPHNQLAGQTSAVQEAVWPALRFIEENLSGNLSNAELARLCHWSEDYFIRRFRECVGQSPAQYIVERRIARAAQELLFSPASIEAIAENCGFANRFYFSRVFARQIGVAPAAYRKLSRL